MSYKLLTFCVLLGGVPSIWSTKWLTPPIGPFRPGCHVGNLIVSDYGNRVYVNTTNCGASVDSKLYNYGTPFVVSFEYVHPEYNQASKFLISAMDLTRKRLMWLASNCSLDKRHINPRFDDIGGQPTILKPYSMPKWDRNHREIEIEILVFQQTANFPRLSAKISQHEAQNFNISEYLDLQTYYGARFAGPVGGNAVKIYNTKWDKQICEENNYIYNFCEPFYPDGRSTFPTHIPFIYSSTTSFYNLNLLLAAIIGISFHLLWSVLP